MPDTASTPAVGLRILSVEDEPETVMGPLDSLDLEGHAISRAEDLETARRLLTTEVFDFLIVDQRLGQDEELLEGGSTLVRELKEGQLGPLNVEVPFVFLTGSEAWVDGPAMSRLGGYGGVLLKGDALTPKLKVRCQRTVRR